MLKVKGDEILDSKDFFIKWDTKLKISESAAIVTRYSQSKIDKMGIPPQDAFKCMYEWLLEADYIIGHNILGFDVYLIKEFCKLMNKPYDLFVNKFIDTYCIVKGIKANIPYKKDCPFIEYQYKMNDMILKGVKGSLTYLAHEYNIPIDETKTHDGAYDLMLNKQIWDVLKYKVEI
jgi:hypothetical protein